MLNWNSSLLLGVIIVFLIIFFWNFFIGKKSYKGKLDPLHNLDKKKIMYELQGVL